MHFLITAGGTREYIDPVRFISNSSSGKMGTAIAAAAMNAGHKVTLIITASCGKIPKASKIIKVTTAAEMSEAVRKNLPLCDCLIMAAAVSDYTPAVVAESKIKRTGKSLTLKLKPTVDILKEVAANKKKEQIIVGFALEDRDIKARAEKKFKEKKLDMIIANKPAVIGSDSASVFIRTSECKWLEMQSVSKEAIAKKIIGLVEDVRRKNKQNKDTGG